LTTVIVLDAHDEGYVQEQAPTWDAPTVAAERARRAAAPCLWVSACPTVEMLAAATEVHLVSRAEERAGWATLRVVDTRDQDPRSGLYSQPLVEVLRHEQRRVVCVLNRKGRGMLLDCAACRQVATCEKCEAAVTMVGEGLVCRRCGATRPVVCRSCASDALRLRRPGVSRAREQLEALTGRPTGEFWAGSGPLPEEDVVVGTEAVLYREAELRRRGGVGAVAFLDFDQELLAPRYRAGEEALALLARASRVLGGRDGQIVVQTRVPDHLVLTAALMADPALLAAAEQPVRKALRLPPFGALAVLAGPGAIEMAAGVEKLEAEAEPGPGRSPNVGGTGAPALEVTQLADDRWVVRAGDPGQLADALGAVGRPAERVRVEVGPARF
jgi:primosomal protein N' (replication factor Y)